MPSHSAADHRQDNDHPACSERLSHPNAIPRPVAAQSWLASKDERNLALGSGFDYIGGTNVSTIHWDIVKNVRFGGRIELDGKVVQENGIWVA